MVIENATSTLLVLGIHYLKPLDEIFELNDSKHSDRSFRNNNLLTHLRLTPRHSWLIYFLYKHVHQFLHLCLGRKLHAKPYQQNQAEVVWIVELSAKQYLSLHYSGRSLVFYWPKPY
jgi:hypothetical protein